jgi:hypothetical protein
MDIGKAFGFATKDESWLTKVLVGGLVSLIPFIGQFVVSGYSLRVAKNVAQGQERVLPEWNEFSDFLTRGFLAWVIQLVYFLPFGLFYGIFVALITIPAAAAAESGADAGAAGALVLCLAPLMLILALACSMAAFSAVARYVVTDQLSEAFKFGEVFASLRQNLGTFAMLIAVAFLAGLVASLGLIACGVGILFTSFYAYLVIGHAFGQALPQLFPQRDIAAPSGYPPVQSF